jgi:hypothetical protein
VLRKLVNDSEFILVATRFGKKSIVLWCFQWMLVFNFITSHTDFDIKHDMKWMERKKKGKEMKIWVPPFQFYNCILFCDLAELGCVCVFFSVIKLWFTKLTNICFSKHNLEWKRSFSSKKTSVACAVGPSVTTSSTDFSFQNLVFLKFIWIFSDRNHLKINISQILGPNLTK